MSERLEKARSNLADVVFRARGFAPLESGYGAMFAFVITIAAWQLVSSLGWVSSLFLPSPAAIVTALYNLALSGDLRAHVTASLWRIVSGWSLGTVAGLVVGFAMGLWGPARAVGKAYVSALFPIPKIALLPLLILWLGIGEPSKIATIALGVFFPTVIAVYSGVDGVPRNLIRMAQSFNVPFLQILTKVVLPGALPSILAGMRISTSFALLLLVAAEMVGADRGIGSFILQAGNLMQTDNLLAGVVLLSVLGLINAKAIGWAENRLLRWR